LKPFEIIKAYRGKIKSMFINFTWFKNVLSHFVPFVFSKWQNKWIKTESIATQKDENLNWTRAGIVRYLA
jgi:hypothetical protein